APTGSPRPPGQSPVPARRHAAWHSAAPPRAPAGATDIPSRARPQSARRPPPATDRPHQPTAPARADQPNRGLASLPPPRGQPFYLQATCFPNSYGKRSSTLLARVPASFVGRFVAVKQLPERGGIQFGTPVWWPVPGNRANCPSEDAQQLRTR